LRFVLLFWGCNTKKKNMDMNMDEKAKPLNLLLIEDNGEDIRLLKKILLQSKFPPFLVEDRDRLATARERLREGNIEIILLDLGLPDSSGMETFLQIQAEAPDIAIIILTGFGDDKFALEALQQGAQDYLVKGQIDPRTMLRALRYAIERKKIEQELKKANKDLEGEIARHKRTEDQLQASLEEKEVLLKEIHHRVKNNLQLISSLLNLQARRINDQQSLTVFDECKNKVNSIALIHEKLYESEDLANINFGEYIYSLTNELFRTFPGNLSHIALNRDLEDVFLKVNKAIPCALIINELFTNTLKYGFPPEQKQEGEIVVQLKSTEKGKTTLIIADNGVGLPAHLDVNETKTLGMQIVNALVGQLHGSVQIDRSKGTKFIIEFQIDQ